MTQTAVLPEPAAIVDQGVTDLLVAYDFSAAAATALEYAAELARRFGSKIHVISVETPAEHTRVMSTEPRVREHVREDLERAFDHIEKRLCTRGIPCRLTHRVGEVPEILEGATLEGKTDLLLLGAFGHGRTDRPQLGSTAEYILRVAHCPVLTIGPCAVQHFPSSPKIDRIICVTTSPGNDHALLTFSSRFAAAVHARLELLHIVDSEHRAAPTTDQARRCEISSRFLRDHGIHVSWTLLYGAPDELIPARAAEAKASLVILRIGRPEQPDSTYLDQAVVDIIRKAHCPVLTVPSGSLESGITERDSHSSYCM